MSTAGLETVISGTCPASDVEMEEDFLFESGFGPRDNQQMNDARDAAASSSAGASHA